MSSATPVELVGAVVVLAGTVVAGTVAHELSHALALRAFDVPFAVEFFPDRDDAGLPRADVGGTWATVTPTAVPAEFAPWRLRTAAMMPLLLATPFALVAAGVLPDPFAAADPYPKTAALGWLACALPSPQDFSLLWYPRRAIAEYGPGVADAG